MNRHRTAWFCPKPIIVVFLTSSFTLIEWEHCSAPSPTNRHFLRRQSHLLRELAHAEQLEGAGAERAIHHYHHQHHHHCHHHHHHHCYQVARELPPTQPLPSSHNDNLNSRNLKDPTRILNESQACQNGDQSCQSECLIHSCREVIIPQIAPSLCPSEPQVIRRASRAPSTAKPAKPLHLMTVVQSPLRLRQSPKVRTTDNASTQVTRCFECLLWPNIGIDQALITGAQMNL